MANLIWRGDAQAIAQVVKVTPSNPEAGDTFTLKINGKEVSYVATNASVSTVVAGLVEAWSSATFPEATQVLAAAHSSGAYLTLTAATAGVPFKVSTSTTDAGGFQVDVETITAGDPGQNEIQRVSIPSAASGGTFTLTFQGQTTGNIDYNANAAAVESALEALSNIASGDVSVTGDTPQWSVEFLQAYANTNVASLTGNGANLTGAASISHNTTTEGSPGTNEIQSYTTAFALNISEAIRFRFGGVLSSVISTNATASSVESTLESLSTIGSGNVSVTRTGSFNDYTYTIEFIGSLGNQNVETLRVENETGTTGGNCTVVQEGSATGVDEVQTVTINGSPTGGTFTLTFQGQTTSGIAYNAAAAAVESALEALSNIDAVSVVKSGWTYTITFEGTLAGTDVAQLTSSAASLTGGGITVITTQAATTPQNEIQEITLTPDPSGGTFTLTIDPGGGDETTGTIAYNASASTVQTAIEALTSFSAGDVEVTGDAGGPWVVEFKSTYAATNMDPFEGDGSSLTGGGSQGLAVETTTRSAGPNHFDDPDNWTSEAVPNATDSLYFCGGDIDCLWGLKQRANFTADAGTDVITLDGGAGADFREAQGVRLYTTDTLPAGLSTGTTYYIKNLDIDAGTCQLAATPGGAAIDITDTGTGTHTIGLLITLLSLHSRWSGALGITERNDAGFYEYRPRSLAALITTVVVGEGEGDGQDRVDLDTGNEATSITVYQTGGGQEPGLPAMRWKGNNASNAVVVMDGEFGAAVYATETATIDSLTQRGGLIQMGTVTLGDIDKTAGELIADNVTMNGSLALKG